MIKQIYRFDCSGCTVCCLNSKIKESIGKVFSKEELKNVVLLREELFDIFYLKTDGGYYIGEHCKNYIPKKGLCGIYRSRPPECILYPFVVFKRSNQLIIGIDNECSQSKKFLSDLDRGEKSSQLQIKNIEENINTYPFLIYDSSFMAVFDFTVIAVIEL